ncbi:helix-turn-helix transcriptional regulator [Actinoplanes sp. CA-030573]|uniref:helix-turn-helix transcriptional regulator n=1 Tax=Actinoplanes sp. CA-030573 TaxID=3239898 RepID=UPI003D8B0679
MTRPTARVLALLEILQRGGTHTASGLAARLGLDERTVRRYVEHLLDLEVPVESVRGRHGGYRLAPGFRMPPLMLTDEEALAVMLGLVATGQESAAAKVRRVLPKPLAARLDALFGSTSFLSRSAPVPPEAALMLRLAEAIRLRRPAAIAYTDRAGRRTERTLCPYGMVARSGRWYVTGADSASGRVRTFRLDRIVLARIVEGSFAVPEGFDPGASVRSGLAATPWRHRVAVLVRGAVEDVRARLPEGLATIEPATPDGPGGPGEPDRRNGPDGPGWVLVRLRAERLDWLPAVLAGLGLPFVVREPAELRELTHAWATRLAGCAAATSPAEAAHAYDRR